MVAYRVSLALAVLVAITATGCEYAFSDVATRIRYRLDEAIPELPTVTGATITVSLKPDHWPDACPGEGGYQVLITPPRGDKQVASGDIMIRCKDGHSYYTGLGTEKLLVPRDLSVAKRREEFLRITLRRVPEGIEVAALE